MRIFIDTAKRDRRCHHKFGFGTKGKKGIYAGEHHLVISNGTIGRGCVNVNINNSDAIVMLTNMLTKLNESRYIESKPIIWEREEENNQSAHYFTADDIPF